uniref:Phycocyanin beta subunit n=1 Tax=Cyanoptyche gloeocystis TaxID=77922 RepID=A0A3G1IWF7_9EUKA|nr:phycocyanin beta subunit [Cyanoptyche gloeocystis]|mmetsp:Transcript_15401/g.26445  ORF Transcript_15401/g.26445 Transcript_15401/m.26445 type:complete len:173 (+) Transcript_15401:92-610(+)|eukprot:CAMPEP_0196667830 /NCGR_PEP_ID=MMETSP1086-20130531/65295_1 /TAXON_ID=77921 /ORGANISM="Cyanoptyche  gloeocystis , Strain SAG4.97" /LENGTH=172 /DNA_ID=CAMNT_0042005191 /DNA_START=92 /DNA_END=610 /DNA_ORIENTATION=+
MVDIFGRVVAQADSRGDFISTAQFDALSRVVAEGNKRLDAVARLTASASAIVAGAARSLFAEQPQLIQPGGNAYTNRRAAACLRDLQIVLRYITYAVIAGDSSILDDRCLNGLRETYQLLGVPASSVAVGIQKMKESALEIVGDPSGITSGDCTIILAEVASYFDRAAAAVA